MAKRKIEKVKQINPCDLIDISKPSGDVRCEIWRALNTLSYQYNDLVDKFNILLEDLNRLKK